MSRGTLRGTASIVGVGLSRLGKVPDTSHLELTAEAVHAALQDAGLSLHDIDGVFAANNADLLGALAVSDSLGLRPVLADGTNIGGSSFLAHLQWAALALDAGLCTTALIAYGSNIRSHAGGFRPRSPSPYEDGYGMRNPVASYALAAQRHMHVYGTRPEQLAEVAVAARAWAALNPRATMREPIGIADVLGARRICDPFGLLDCCLVSDGAGAVIVTTPERARHRPQPPVHLLGVAAEQWHYRIADMPDLTRTAASRSGPRAFAMAGLRSQDVDVLQLYDAFTINPILFLEDLGFCAKGEGGPFVADGRLAPGGALPVNTNGGGLSCVHPGMYGIFLLVEAVEQLRGQAGARQVPDAQVALCHGNGGTLSSQVTALLGTEATL